MAYIQLRARSRLPEGVTVPRPQLILVCFFLFALGPMASGAIPCPAMPAAVTEVQRDINSDINAGVGTLGKLKAGELQIKTEVVAKNLFSKYPNVDKLLALQTMSATYCAMLRDSSLTDKEKLDRWEIFQNKVLDLKNNPNPKPATPRKFGDLPPTQADRVKISQVPRSLWQSAQELHQKVYFNYGFEGDGYALILHLTAYFSSSSFNEDLPLLQSAEEIRIRSVEKGIKSGTEKLSLVKNSTGGRFLEGIVALTSETGESAFSGPMALTVGGRDVKFAMPKMKWERVAYSSDGKQKRMYVAQAEMAVELAEPSWPVIRRVRVLTSTDSTFTILDIVVENFGLRPLSLENMLIRATHHRTSGTSCMNGDRPQEVFLSWVGAASESSDEKNWTEIGSKRVQFPAEFNGKGRCSNYSFRALVPLSYVISSKSIGQVQLQLLELPKVSKRESGAALFGAPFDISGPSLLPENIMDWENVSIALNATTNSTNIFPGAIKIGRRSVKLDSILRE